jgi:hypothetical protein
MKAARSSRISALFGPLLSAAGTLLAFATGFDVEAGETQVRFQRPGATASAAASNTSTGENPLRFRSPSATPSQTVRTVREEAPAEQFEQTSAELPQAKPLKAARPNKAQAVEQAPVRVTAKPAFTQAQPSVRQADYRLTNNSRQQKIVALDGSEPLTTPMLSRQRGAVQQVGFCDTCVGCTEPACGIGEPDCGCAEPACGICEPGCGVQEPGCGVMEPGCGCDQPECGSCVGSPGPDYICFPVCVPRFKELLFWGGVHGFKGPRDAPNLGGSGDGNFGFQEGVNIGGRAPLVGLIFPQISYQLGYQSVQSQLSGRSNGDTNDRIQHFVTAGVFRRVAAGLQFGAVWDHLHDDFLADADFNQVRYEISLKGQSGLEAGFWGATHANDVFVSGFDFQTVDQYNFFLRYHFPSACEGRFWGGFTNDHEGIFGGDFYMPFNNRWSLQTGFNYLIPQDSAGQIAAQNESWNVGMNLVWHYGFTAKASRTNPHRPLFTTADNGTMFVDERP